jgi:hypothetical protein
MAKNQQQDSKQKRSRRGQNDLSEAARELRQGDSEAASELGREGGRARGRNR